MMQFHNWLKQQRYRLDYVGEFYHFVESALVNPDVQPKPPVGVSTLGHWVKFINDNKLTLDISGNFLIAYYEYCIDNGTMDSSWLSFAEFYISHVNKMYETVNSTTITDVELVKKVRELHEILDGRMEYLIKTIVRCKESIYGR